MGKIGGIFGTRISGAVGQVVFRVVNGKSTVSQKPDKVSNPKTIEQQTQRMVFTTCITAYSAMKGICDHSFEGLRKGSENQAEFMRKNLAWLKSQDYNFSVKGNPSIVPNAYRISKGSLAPVQYRSAKPVQQNSINGAAVILSEPIAASALTTMTVKQFHDLINAQIGDQITVCAVRVLSDSGYRFSESELQYECGFDYARIIFNVGTDDELLMADNAIKGANVNTVDSLNYENIVIAQDSTNLQIGVVSDKFGILEEPIYQYCAAGVIISRKSDGKWLRSTQNLAVETQDGAHNYTADKIVPTYDPNSEYYLNHATR